MIDRITDGFGEALLPGGNDVEISLGSSRLAEREFGRARTTIKENLGELKTGIV